jgi:hypothetical protein
MTWRHMLVNEYSLTIWPNADHRDMTPTKPIPTSLKIAYTAFMSVLVPVYWYFYGPTNFLYFCDVALILTLVGMWRNSPLLVSMCAVGILLPQLLWCADFVAGFGGVRLTGMTTYMFNPDSPIFLRGLSLFHGWIPFLLLYLVWRLGYDRRALVAWTVLAWALLVVCFVFMPEPMANPGLRPVNINYVWGMSDTAKQTMMPAAAWFATLLAGLPVLLFVPTHFLLRKLAPAAAGHATA